MNEKLQYLSNIGKRRAYSEKAKGMSKYVFIMFLLQDVIAIQYKMTSQLYL